MRLSIVFRVGWWVDLLTPQLRAERHVRLHIKCSLCLCDFDTKWLTPQFRIIFPSTRFNDDPLSGPGLRDEICPKILMLNIAEGAWKCPDVSKWPSWFISRGLARRNYTASHPRRPECCFIVVMGVQTDGQNGFNRRSAGMPTHLKNTTVDNLVRHIFMCLGNTNGVNLMFIGPCIILIVE